LTRPALDIGRANLFMATPATPEIPTQPGCFGGKPPLVIGRRTSHDRGFGQDAAPNLAHNPIQTHAGERSHVFEHVPGAGVRAHFAKHALTEILIARVTPPSAARDELPARNAWLGISVPHLIRHVAEGPNPPAGGDFQRMITGRKAGRGLWCHSWFGRLGRLHVLHGVGFQLIFRFYSRPKDRTSAASVS